MKAFTPDVIAVDLNCFVFRRCVVKRETSALAILTFLSVTDGAKRYEDKQVKIADILNADGESLHIAGIELVS